MSKNLARAIKTETQETKTQATGQVRMPQMPEHCKKWC